jgi:transforming growth factor-beta-induced protein
MSSSKNSKRSILQFLFDKKDFEDLFELIIRVGLAGALESPGPFTVFAPTNDAFDNGLPTPLVLGADIDIGKLLFKEDAFIPHTRNFVLNHVLGGQVLAADISNGLVAGTFAGEAIGFNIATDPYSSQTSLFANGVQVTKTDQIQNNGVVHTLGGGVLNPSWVFSSVAFRAVQIAETSVLFALLGLAGIDLTGPGEFTLIAPVNAAFTALPESTQNCLVDPLNVVALQQVLAFHVLKGVITAADFQDGTKYKTLEGGKVKVTLDPFLFEGIANPLALDILANNGVVHLIGAVLDPGTVCDFQRPKQGGGGGSGSGKMSSKGDKRRRSRH